MSSDDMQSTGGEAGGGVSAAGDLYADRGSQEAALVPVFTLVVWLVCAGVGVAGMVVGYGRPGSYVEAAAVTPAGFVKVDVPKEEARPVEKVTPKLSVVPEEAAPAAPAAPQQVELPAAPAPVAVAAPSAAVAFAVPVEGLVRLVDPDVAAHGRPTEGARGVRGGVIGGTGTGLPGGAVATTRAAAGPAPSAVRHLTFGEGEGAQPAPEYPREAVLAHEEGTVVIRFSVDETGRVTAAAVAEGCRFPVLNQAALRVVRERWRFSPGAARRYEVPIEFQLQ